MRSAGAVCAAARHAPGTRRTAPPQKPVPARVTQARCLRRAAMPSRHPHGPFSRARGMQPPYKGGTTAQHTGRFPERAACDRPTRVAPPCSTLAAFLRERAACAAAYFGAVHAQIPVFPARSALHAPRVSPSPANARHVLEAPARLAAQKPIPRQRRRRKAIPPGGLPALLGSTRTFPCPYCPRRPTVRPAQAGRLPNRPLHVAR